MDVELNKILTLETYEFMGFVTVYFAWIFGAAVAIFTGMYGVRVSQPKAFNKVRSHVLPYGLGIIAGLLIFMLLGIRLNLGSEAPFLAEVTSGEPLSGYWKDRANEVYLQNRRTALMLDVLWFAIVAWVALGYALDFIDWLVKDDDETNEDAH